jgi:hypothetical protein
MGGAGRRDRGARRRHRRRRRAPADHGDADEDVLGGNGEPRAQGRGIVGRHASTPSAATRRSSAASFTVPVVMLSPPPVPATPAVLHLGPARAGTAAAPGGSARRTARELVRRVAVEGQRLPVRAYAGADTPRAGHDTPDRLGALDAGEPVHAAEEVPVDRRPGRPSGGRTTGASNSPRPGRSSARACRNRARRGQLIAGRGLDIGELDEQGGGIRSSAIQPSRGGLRRRCGAGRSPREGLGANSVTRSAPRASAEGEVPRPRRAMRSVRNRARTALRAVRDRPLDASA